MTKKTAKDEANVIEIQAERDEGYEGNTELRFVFPTGLKNGYDRATIPAIKGGFYISKTAILPDEIIIKLK